MDFYTAAKELLERLRCVDGVVLTQHRVLEQALRDAYFDGVSFRVEEPNASDPAQISITFPPDESPY